MSATHTNIKSVAKNNTDQVKRTDGLQDVYLISLKKGETITNKLTRNAYFRVEKGKVMSSSTQATKGMLMYYPKGSTVTFVCLTKEAKISVIDS